MLDIHLTPKSKSENNSEYAYRILYENIMTLRLKPGTIINENEIAQLLSSSRTPVREAILRLKDCHLIDVYPQKASIVSQINLDLLKEGFFMRCMIEPTVIEIACNNLDAGIAVQLKQSITAQEEVVTNSKSIHDFFALDDQFHRLIYQGAGKKYIWNAVQSVSSHFNRIRYLHAICTDFQVGTLFEDHRTMYYNILSGSAENIKRMYPSHLSFYQNSVPKFMEEYSDYFQF